MRERIHDVIYTELICFVGQIDRIPSGSVKLPVLTDIIIVVCHSQETTIHIVPLEQAEKYRSVARIRFFEVQ